MPYTAAPPGGHTRCPCIQGAAPLPLARAGAIASFYWAAGNTESLSVAPVVTAMKNSLVYHMGSIAFGAFIIAIIQFVK